MECPINSLNEQKYQLTCDRIIHYKLSRMTNDHINNGQYQTLHTNITENNPKRLLPIHTHIKLKLLGKFVLSGKVKLVDNRNEL